jgi:hypothetical protein
MEEQVKYIRPGDAGRIYVPWQYYAALFLIVYNDVSAANSLIHTVIVNNISRIGIPNLDADCIW